MNCGAGQYLPRAWIINHQEEDDIHDRSHKENLELVVTERYLGVLPKLDLTKAGWISSRGNRKFTIFMREQ